VGTPLVAASQGSEPQRLVGVEDEVRRMVARELHDRVAQTLTGMLVDVENFKSEQVSWPDVLRQLDTIQTSTRQVLHSLRQLLYDLRGDDLMAEGLPAALRALLTRFDEQTGIRTNLEVLAGWPDELMTVISLNLYRIVEEALANVKMHSGARSVYVVLEAFSDGQLVLRVVDDGRGVDTDPTRVVGLGTVGMRERAMFVGGRLDVESGRGPGTTINVVFRSPELGPEQVEVPPAQQLIVKVTA
jgi:two-component system sensor histidine kinase DegS